MLVKQMHIMRIKEEEAKRSLKKKPSTPLAREIEMRREAIIKGILGNSTEIVNQQLAIASLRVSEDGKDNDTVLKATNSLLDRVFGKPKESIDFTGNVQFSLKDLARKRLNVENEDITPLEDMI